MTDRPAGRPDVDVLVVGAGLAGLCAAHDVAAEGRSVLVLDARPRVGGRMMTVTSEDGGWFDLGATWHWSDQPEVKGLAVRLGIEAFPEPTEGSALHERSADAPPLPVELLPDGDAAALRFHGGTEQLCARLADTLPEGAVALGEKVTAMADGGGPVVVTSEMDGATTTWTSRAVVVAVPPRLVVEDIRFTPVLPAALAELMEATPTWMGEAAKCVAVYGSPFWRAAGWSGSAFSDAGPLDEVHDASVPDGAGALWGFVALDADVRSLGPDERAPLVFEQLGRLFGPEAADPIQYFERDWSADPNTCEREHRHVTPVPYGHPSYAEPLWDARLAWAGTETEGAGGGHMEGAVRSGRRAARQVLASLR